MIKMLRGFSNLETGQSSAIDAQLSIELIADVTSQINPKAKSLLDIGCGAGNYSLKILERLPNLDVTLLDLSRPMLKRAVERLSSRTSGKITAIQRDIREAQIGESEFDIICAAAVLHHLREEKEWQQVFSRIYAALKPGGSFWISDIITHSNARVQSIMWQRYGEYLSRLKDDAYRDEVFAYIEKEDSPRSLLFQVDLLRSVGFKDIEVLHKNCCFATFGAIK